MNSVSNKTKINYPYVMYMTDFEDDKTSYYLRNIFTRDNVLEKLKIITNSHIIGSTHVRPCTLDSKKHRTHMMPNSLTILCTDVSYQLPDYILDGMMVECSVICLTSEDFDDKRHPCIIYVDRNDTESISKYVKMFVDLTPDAINYKKMCLETASKINATYKASWLLDEIDNA